MKLSSRSIINKLHETAEDVQTKWKDLVDTFRTKEKSGAEGGTIAEKAQQWQFYDRMTFMKPYMYKRRYSRIMQVRKVS